MWQVLCFIHQLQDTFSSVFILSYTSFRIHLSSLTFIFCTLNGVPMHVFVVLTHCDKTMIYIFFFELLTSCYKLCSLIMSPLQCMGTILVYIYRGWLISNRLFLRSRATKSFFNFRSPKSQSEPLDVISILKCAWRPNFTFF